jgi:hypothetical protein
MEDEILNKLEHLLRNAVPEDFLRACKRKSISKYMKSALESLALECLEKTSNLKNSNMTESYKQTAQMSLLDKRVMAFSSDRTGSKTETDRIHEVLINAKRFANKTAMVDFAKYIGFKITFNNKDSRARVARKLAIAIASSQDQTKKRALSILYEKLDNQTKGWFDIIRSK